GVVDASCRWLEVPENDIDRKPFLGGLPRGIPGRHAAHPATGRERRDQCALAAEEIRTESRRYRGKFRPPENPIPEEDARHGGMMAAVESEKLYLDGPAGRLEAILESGSMQPSAVAVVCHPH